MLDVKKLLTKMLNVLDTSTWNNLGNGVTYRRHHGVLYISIYGTGISVSTSYKVLGTLPVGFRPTGTYYTVVGFGGTTNSAIRILNSSDTTIAQQRVYAAASNWNALQCMTVVTPATTETFRVSGATSRAYTSATMNWILAVRLA